MPFTKTPNKNPLPKLTEQEEYEIAELMTRSRIQMLMAFPFFGILALHLKMVASYDIETMGTNGTILWYNPSFVKSLVEGERNFILVHEVLHAALKHIWRKGNRQDDKWNYACDFATNSIIVDFINNAESKHAKTLQLPKSGCYNRDFQNKSAEEIYDLLPDNPNGGGGSGGQQVLDDHGLWGDNSTQEGGETQAAEWEGRMISAAKAAESKSAGNIPGFLKRLLGQLTKPQKNWKALLQEFVEPEVDDYSFNPPDRRFSDFDFFLPDFNDETQTVKNIVLWCDTSGSIGEKELTACYSEVVGAINQFAGKLQGKLGFFDHSAYGLTDFDDVNSVLAIRPKGGGGTCFSCPFEYINEHHNDDDIAGIIIFTDGYASFPNQSIANGVPVLWIVTNEDVTPPWGLHTTIKV